MNIIGILIPCLVCGIIFAALASWLTTRKGNTIKDVLDSQKFKDAEGIKLEIKKIISISSSYPIIGMYVIAGIIAIGFPSYAYWTIYHDTQNIILSGNVLKEPNKNVYLVPDNMRIYTSGKFKIPLRYRSDLQEVNFESQFYSPLTLSITIDKDKNILFVESNDDSIKEDLNINIESRLASLERPIRLKPAPQQEISNQPTQPDTQSYAFTFSPTDTSILYLRPLISDTSRQPIEE